MNRENKCLGEARGRGASRGKGVEQHNVQTGGRGVAMKSREMYVEGSGRRYLDTAISILRSTWEQASVAGHRADSHAAANE